MKKLIFFCCALVVFLWWTPMQTAAQQDEQDVSAYEDSLAAYDFSFFEKTLDEDTYSYLQELGLEDFDFQTVADLSVEDVAKLLLHIAQGKIREPLEGVTAVLLFIVLSALIKSMREDDSELLSTVSALITAVILVAKISPVLTLGAAAVKIASGFIYAFVPVFAAIVAAGGGITTSFSTNALLLMLSQVLSVLSAHLFMPIVNSFLALGICSGLRTQLHLSGLVSAVKRLLITALSFLSGLYVSVLSLKTTVAARADVLGLRSLRLVINSVVPVVGGALSEGLISIQSYSSLIKSSVGVVGIAAIVLVFLPAVLETALWRAVLTLLQTVGDVFGDSNVSAVVGVFRDALLIVNAVLIVSALTAVISFGVLIAAHTS